MYWFKHLSDMSEDRKVKRLIRRYGSDGYAVYVYIIERIVKTLNSDSPTPDLEESSVDIAQDFAIETTRVEEIIWYCIQQGLFEQDEDTGRVVAHKVYKFIDQSMSSSPEIRKMLQKYKKQHTEAPQISNHQPQVSERQARVSNYQPRVSKHQDVSDQTRLEETRIEEKREEKESSAKADSVIDYLNEKAGKQFRHSHSSRKYIRARLDEGYTVDDCKHVVDVKASKWLGGDMEPYLRPQTLFRPEKFEGYLNERVQASQSIPYEPEPIVRASDLGKGLQ